MDTVIYFIINSIISIISEQKASILTGIVIGVFIYLYYYRELDKLDNEFKNIIEKSNEYLRRIRNMEKTEIRMMLDAVAEFNNSINGFKENIVSSMRSEMKEMKGELKEYFTTEINNIKVNIQEIETDIQEVKKEAGNNRLLVHEQKYKLTWAISIAVFISSLLIGIIQHFIFKII